MKTMGTQESDTLAQSRADSAAQRLRDKKSALSLLSLKHHSAAQVLRGQDDFREGRLQ